MGWLLTEKDEKPRPHVCDFPIPNDQHEKGDLWVCDICKTIWRLQSVDETSLEIFWKFQVFLAGKYNGGFTSANSRVPSIFRSMKASKTSIKE